MIGVHTTLGDRHFGAIATTAGSPDEGCPASDENNDRPNLKLMRALWTQEVIDYEGRWHRIPGAGINPLPVQRPIPVWIGGYVTATMDRIGRIGDGWFPQSQDGEFPGARVEVDLEHIARAARAATRRQSAWRRASGSIGSLATPGAR